jgi:hypothetical protein
MTDKIASVEPIELNIFLVRGQKILLDEDLAALYEVATKVLNQEVKRNIARFPEDFMFQLSTEEFARLKLPSALPDLKSQTVTLKSGRGQHRKYTPYAFTEQGVAMLSSILRNDCAIQVNIEIMRAFVRLRQMLAANAELSRKLVALETKYDIKFKAVFEAIRELMTPLESKKKRPIDFAPWEKNNATTRPI